MGIYTDISLDDQSSAIELLSAPSKTWMNGNGKGGGS
jgi:hypothetical protein